MEAAVGAILDLSEAHARRIVADWPDGTWKGEALSTTTASAARTSRSAPPSTKRGDSLTVDLSESDEQATGFVNSSFPNMHSAVCMAFAFLLDPEVAKNDGAFRPLEVVAREGTSSGRGKARR